MRVTLIFTTHFRSMLGVEEWTSELPAGTTVAEAVQAFLDAHPEHTETITARKGFLLGELRAIYSIDGKAVQREHALADGDELKVLKAHIGG